MKGDGFMHIWFDTVITQQEFFKELYDFLLHLGYQPKQSPTKDLIFVFQKKGKKIAKFSYSLRYGPSLHMKFYANRTYPSYFHEKVRETMESSSFKYTGMIKGAIEGLGYRYQFPDGRKYFLFHREMIDVGLPPSSLLKDIKDLLQVQDAHWTLGGQ